MNPEHVRAVVLSDPDLAPVLTRMLRLDGWEVAEAHTVPSAAAAAAQLVPDVAVVDLTVLGDVVATDLLDELRLINPKITVLLLCAPGGAGARVQHLLAPADEAVAKPFSLEDVLARVHGLARHAGVGEPGSEPELVVGDLVMEEESREVWRGGEPVALTATEFELLRYLMRNPGRVISKSQILERVWNFDFGGDAHVVELYISYLRRKLETGRTPMIHTIRGMGYQLRPAAEEAGSGDAD